MAYKLIFAAVALMAAFHLGRFVEHRAQPIPVLIGHDCAGSGGDLWAMQEDDFPPCAMIERNQ